jgi:hypothetical protein
MGMDLPCSRQLHNTTCHTHQSICLPPITGAVVAQQVLQLHQRKLLLDARHTLGIHRILCMTQEAIMVIRFAMQVMMMHRVQIANYKHGCSPAAAA